MPDDVSVAELPRVVTFSWRRREAAAESRVPFVSLADDRLRNLR
jgi:hypothetical protein